ncbi:NfeD family protein [Algiphilus aromaticivorans]|uniref:NfeD family protein n=1 Tax=Algiphilus aromaticivorans TaxID=382454 RepID=UPI0018DDA4A1|nr:NfeD family protein [Algiphilus aromaticivorans]
MKRALAMLLLGAGVGLSALQVAGQEGATDADAARAQLGVITIDGAISPATSDYLESAHAEAVEDGATVVLIELDTPGGLVTATRDMIQIILQSEVPVITWVTPEGARAASAGTYILYASHVAAMAPATNVGAATPVQMGGAPQPQPGDRDAPDKSSDSEAKGGEDANDEDRDQSGEKESESASEPKSDSSGGSAMEKKAINDAVAYIRSLAERRGRNADWAEEAVREGVSISANAALERNVIDLVAGSLDELLSSAHGMEVEMHGGATRTLALENADIRRYEPGWRHQFLAIITNPTIAYVLMMIGIYGLLLEGYSPGAILPGTVGAIALLLALYAFQLMPVNYVGLGLLLLGIVLMIAEALAPSFGILGFGGLAAFVLGSIFLMDSDVPGYDVNIGLIVGLALAMGLLLAITFYMLYRSRKARISTGEEGTLDGQIGEVVEFADGRGWMRLNGERWQIRSNESLSPGQRVRVTGHDGFTAHVVAADGSSGGPQSSY